jgi:hypothetical protein
VLITSIVGGLAAFFTITGFFGSMWWLFDLLANYRWQLLWVSLICAIVYALAARGIASVVFLVAVVVNAFVISPLWFGSQPEGTGEDSISVVTIDMEGSTTEEESLLRWLLDTDADLIIAQGVAPERLLPLTVDGSLYRLVAAPDPDTTGVAIVAKGDWAVATTRTETTNEAIHAVSVPAGDGSITVVSAWGPIATNTDEAQALEERIDAIAAITESRTTPVAVVGSIGATRFTSGVRGLLGSSGLRDATEGSGYLSTWPVSDLPLIGGWIGIPLDLVLMTVEVTPLSLETGPAIGVDHLPVTVVIGPTIGS